MNIIKKSRKANKLGFIISNLILFIYTLANLYFVYNVFRLTGIENLVRYLVIGLTIILNILFWFINTSLLIKKKKKKRITLSVILLILALIFIFIAFNIDKVVSSLGKMSKEKVIYSSSLITLKENNLNSIKDLTNKKIGLINDQESIEGYQIPNLIIKENNLKKTNEINIYDNPINMLSALYNKELDAIIVSSNYIVMYQSIEQFENIADITKVITKKEKEYQVKQTTSNKSLTEPFTILLMGVDSEKDGLKENAAFNGDALMLITFNPKTLNTTMLSIPRDTYVPIACFKNQYENKITHAAWNGESCMIDTIQNLTNIKIDYFVKINFKGVVSLVDALGGIDIDVPFSFCEQDSNRLWDKNTVFVEKGQRTLNGEQALALARHRKETSYMASYCGKKYLGNTLSDFVRGQNQQLLIKGMLNKLKGIRDINSLYNILDAIQKNIDTNITTNQILSLYNIFKDVITNQNSNINELFTIQRLYLSGYDQYIYDEHMHLTLYNYIYYRGSLKDIVDAMKINLELTKLELIKTFSYSVNQAYEEVVIGKGHYKVVDHINTLPDFVNQNKQEVASWAIQNGFTINYTYETNNNHNEDTIIKQSYPYGYRLNDIKNKTLTITLSKKAIASNSSDNNPNDPITYCDCSVSTNFTNEACLLPDFSNSTITAFKTWYNKLSRYNIHIPTPQYEIITEEDSNYDADKQGSIIKQSILPNTPLNEVESLTITYIKVS